MPAIEGRWESGDEGLKRAFSRSPTFSLLLGARRWSLNVVYDLPSACSPGICPRVYLPTPRAFDLFTRCTSRTWRAVSRFFFSYSKVVINDARKTGLCIRKCRDPQRNLPRDTARYKNKTVYTVLRRWDHAFPDELETSIFLENN